MGRSLGREAEMSLSFPLRTNGKSRTGSSRPWQIRVEAAQRTGLLDHTGPDGPDHRQPLKCRGHPGCHVPPHAGDAARAPPTPALARPGPAGLQELVWGERTSMGAPLGSQKAPASPVTPPTGRARRGTGGGTGTPAGWREAQGEPPATPEPRSPAWGGRAQRAWARHPLLNTEVTTPDPHGRRGLPFFFLVGG